jgi:hypothetical protein
VREREARGVHLLPIDHLTIYPVIYIHSRIGSAPDTKACVSCPFKPSSPGSSVVEQTPLLDVKAQPHLVDATFIPSGKQYAHADY